MAIDTFFADVGVSDMESRIDAALAHAEKKPLEADTTELASDVADASTG